MGTIPRFNNEPSRWKSAVGERENIKAARDLYSQIISKHLVTVTSVAVITLLPTLRFSNSRSSNVSHVERTQRTKRLLLQDFFPECTGESGRGVVVGGQKVLDCPVERSSPHRNLCAINYTIPQLFNLCY